MYAIYDLKNNEQCVGVFKNCQEIADYFGTTRNTICSTISRRKKRERRYEIVKIKE